MDTLLSPKQAAAHATVSEALIRRWLADGTLPHFRLGAKGRRGKIMIDRADLDALLASCKVTKAVPASPARQPARSVFKHLRLG